MDEEQLRIRSYLQAQAAKLTLPQLVERVRADMSQLHDALNAAPAARFAERPSPDDWSANEVANHLATTSKTVGDRVCAVLADGARPGAVADRLGMAGVVKDADGWWAMLRADREALFERVLQAAGDEYLDVTWSHPFFGELNWREWLLFTRLHDLDHARQMQSIAEALASQ